MFAHVTTMLGQTLDVYRYTVIGHLITTQRQQHYAERVAAHIFMRKLEITTPHVLGPPHTGRSKTRREVRASCSSCTNPAAQAIAPRTQVDSVYSHLPTRDVLSAFVDLFFLNINQNGYFDL